jgi:hypothetical protein
MKWSDLPPEERAKRWQNVRPETHGEWLYGVVERMRREGCGYSVAMEQTRQKEGKHVQPLS